MSFRALRVSKGQPPTVEIATLEDDALMDGDVTVAVSHSTINYKDGLALTGAAPILRRSPMTPGVDFAGEVIASDSAEFAVGDRVVLNGWGVGETHDGGLAERARVKSDWLIHLPDGLSPAEAMAVGTAGYTAALSVLALERFGIGPASGDVLVTGAAGGVGSMAIALLAAAGYRVIASSRRAAAEAGYLTGLGAAEVMDAAELGSPGRPLGKERWAAAIDSVGSHTLANVLAGTRYDGIVRLRPGAGQRSTGHGDAVHPARGDAGRHQLGDRDEGQAYRGMGAVGPGSGPRCAGAHDAPRLARSGGGGRRRDRGRHGARPGRRRPLAFMLVGDGRGLRRLPVAGRRAGGLGLVRRGRNPVRRVFVADRRRLFGGWVVGRLRWLCHRSATPTGVPGFAIAAATASQIRSS